MNRHIEDWIQELSLAIRERYLESNPTINKKELISRSKVTVEDCDKYVKVSIGGVERFAVSKKNEFIYGIRNGNINKREDYGPIEVWSYLDWKPYYPYRKSLYEWKNKEKETVSKEKAKKARRSIARFKMAQGLEDQTWPYTNGSSKTDGIESVDNPKVGAKTTPTNRKQHQTTGRDIPQTKRRKGD